MTDYWADFIRDEVDTPPRTIDDVQQDYIEFLYDQGVDNDTVVTEIATRQQDIQTLFIARRERQEPAVVRIRRRC